MRTNRKRLLSALLVGGLAMATGGGASAGAQSGPDRAHAHPAQLDAWRLGEGQRWPTDEPLRQGMSEIRRAMTQAFPSIHMGRLPQADYAMLAGKIRERVDYVARSCRLPEAADAELHRVLAGLVEGSETMRGPDRVAGAMQVIRALETYGRRFDHPEWGKPRAL
ncbi:MAG: hypothetical protein U0S49_01070 [Rhodospirillales bacterium]|nr:hypothetical protein [Rhodospirillales bacterium]